jgi:hypothetical protein
LVVAVVEAVAAVGGMEVVVAVGGGPASNSAPIPAAVVRRNMRLVFETVVFSNVFFVVPDPRAFM